MTFLAIFLTGILLGFHHQSRTARALELGPCFKELGMESGKIQDSALSASTSYDSGSVGPHHARLRNNKQGGAWCPRHMVSRNSREFLEIDLEDLHVVTGIRTQGRYGNGQGQEYAEQYMIEYWRNNLKKWVRWKDRTGNELLSGNTDTFTVVEQALDPSVICSKLRILPYSDHIRTVCMRIELTGCMWTDGLQSYNVPQGVKKPELDLSDRIYDGSVANGHLSNGLGQLTDGVKGGDNFKLDIKGHGKGYEWIGWKNDSTPLEIVFEFDKVRNFSSIHLYTNNMFTKEVQVFSRARAFFGLRDHKYHPEAVHFSYMPDLVMEHSRNVTIKLHQRIGKFVKLQLYFAHRYILLSEISFDSTTVLGNFTQEIEAPDLGREYSLQGDEVKTTLSKEEPARNLIEKIEESSSAVNPNRPAQSTNYIGPTISVLTLIILVLTSAIVLIVWKNKKSIAKGIEDGLHEDTKFDLKAEPKDDDEFPSHPTTLPFPNYAEIPDVVSKNCILNETLNEKPPPPVPPPPQNYYYRSPTRTHLMLPQTVEKLDNDLNDGRSINKISSEKLRMIEKIGRSQYGDIYLCQLVDSNSKFCSLHTLSDFSFFEGFKREVNTLAKLLDDNVATMLEASLEESPYFVLREYAQYGDLCQFLQDHVAESTNAIASNASILSYGTLIYMATQIASGMKHMESHKMVHKDLATRNCLVGNNYRIQISDLDRYREVYAQDYCQLAGASPLPLRWMSWESALLGKYSCKSDVWSFAVLLWEILTFAREQPFDFLGDDKLLDNLDHYYQNDGQQLYLNIPHNCPKEIYDLMLECWNRNESDRPSFKEIHLFLQRKNLGYKPDGH
ncbi:hypothetical protein ABEB36_001074 [Hypothenemus hampei]|uniref:Uncharacterized protein n=1 Tax=Hypothenemus hampei TaxID=57062 RepID=A0ABD1FE09_HYPHA